MASHYLFLSPLEWKSYELIDTGNFEKLERYGDLTLCRPEPQAIWDKKLAQDEWDGLLQARYVRNKNPLYSGDVQESGSWSSKIDLPRNWNLEYQGQDLRLTFQLSMTAFGHLGVFPEQAVNWHYIFEQVSRIRSKVQAPRVLNLFAYTGGSTLAACAAGAEVVHVDSVKQVVNWASQNKNLSGIEGITRWVVEDALKFVRREVKRGRLYHGIILDPPAYGRGPEGEKWVLDLQINEMLKHCAQLLDPEDHFFLVNTYSIGFSALVMDTALRPLFPKADLETGELVLASATQQKLPMGTFARFSDA